jgi:hypothetical protein
MNNKRMHSETEHSGVAQPPMKVRIQAARRPGWTGTIHSGKLPVVSPKAFKKGKS